MYTQCPECDVAFRVTAQVLKQAAGKVRCGGCGNAFNALLYLSEDNPVTTKKTDAESPAQTMSAAQSAALLRTLDQLAGEDIRIEDTGVEWRVLNAKDSDYDDEIAVDPTPTVTHDQPMRFDDNTPLPDDFDIAAPAVPSPAEPVVVSEPIRSADDSQIDLVFGEPDEWQDLLGALEENAAPAGDEANNAGDEASNDEQPPDMDTQFAIQAEAMGIDLSGMHRKAKLEELEAAEDAVADDNEDAAAADSETSIEEDLMAAAFESEAAAKVQAEAEVAPEELSRAGILEEDDYLDAEDKLETQLDDEQAVAESVEALDAESEEELLAPDPDAELEFAIDDILEEEFEASSDVAEYAVPEIPEVPEPTEEEKTINFLIDQDLLAIAVEDEDGFTSTIVQKQFSSTEEVPRERAAAKAANDGPSDEEIDFAMALAPDAVSEPANPLVETIIMEGDLVHHDLDAARLAAERRAASASRSKQAADKGRHGENNSAARRPGMLAAAVVLFVMLLLQVVHHSREAFATSALFQNTVGPIYRMVGRPVTPNWDISGWRFEATKGSTDDENQVLTIYSRIGNKSADALPYPLVHVSLTDRFEEVIGSRVLEPAEYLAASADPRHTIAAGESFDAVFTIDSLAAEATGFKLNVCYRLSGGQLRCAVEDFR